MTNTEIKNKIEQLDREIWLLEMADRMSDEERKAHFKLTTERNALARELSYREHPPKTAEEIEREWQEENERFAREEEEKRRKWEEARPEAEKILALRVWEAVKNSDFCWVEKMRADLTAKGWI